MSSARRRALTGPDDDMVRESFETTGAVVMGRRMFSGGAGPWEDDPNADGWWDEDPPFRVPVFLLTHHPRETVTKQRGTSFTFVTDGIETALDRARAAAGPDDISVAGGASVIQQYLAAGVSTSSRSTSLPCSSVTASASSTGSRYDPTWSSSGSCTPPK